MAHFKSLIFALAVTLAASEPPAPYNYHAGNNLAASNQYLPPNSGYNAPSNSYIPPSNGYNAPSNNYIPPSNGYNAPNSGYNAPNSGYNAPNSGYNAPNAGYNGGHDSYDEHHGQHGHDNEVPKSYEFGYTVKDAQSGNDYGRQETSDGNTVRGEYRVALPDGRTQIVTYHADWKTGYHADVRYEGEARYPEPQHEHQNGYDYNAQGFSGSLHGFNNNVHNTNYEGNGGRYH